MDLTEAFHAIYDAKDANSDDENIRYAAYETLKKLTILMQLVGTPVPERFDA